MINQAALVLKALGEPTRLKIMKFVSIQELCICELTAILDMSQPRVSQHVKVLKQVGLLKERKVKQKSYFTVNPAALNGPFIESFRSFMQLSPNEIPELADEFLRFNELDKNEEVLACKNDCIKQAADLKKII
ncbi:MAG: metalloregulator ArsR/SmtB family transcription factor [Syntrophomonas sp.]